MPAAILGGREKNFHMQTLLGCLVCSTVVEYLPALALHPLIKFDQSLAENFVRHLRFHIMMVANQDLRGTPKTIGIL